MALDKASRAEAACSWFKGLISYNINTDSGIMGNTHNNYYILYTHTYNLYNFFYTEYSEQLNTRKKVLKLNSTILLQMVWIKALTWIWDLRFFIFY